jgi:hypothetical protein
MSEVVEVRVRSVHDDPRELRPHERVERSLDVAISGLCAHPGVAAHAHCQKPGGDQELLGHITPEAADHLSALRLPLQRSAVPLAVGTGEFVKGAHWPSIFACS